MAQARDAVSNDVSEVLQGIRQVRFSSLEKVWEARILQSRTKELSRIWRAAVTVSYLAFASNVGPILFASISLATYAVETRGRLSPSLAFASLGLFGNIHTVVRDLPMLRARLFQSWVSCQRLQDYLRKAEREGPVDTAAEKSSNQVSVEKATLF